MPDGYSLADIEGLTEEDRDKAELAMARLTLNHIAHYLVELRDDPDSTSHRKTLENVWSVMVINPFLVEQCSGVHLTVNKIPEKDEEKTDHIGYEVKDEKSGSSR